MLAVLGGPQRDRDVREIQKLKALGQVARPPAASKFAHTVLSVTVQGDTAEALECVVDDLEVIEVATGQVLNSLVSTVALKTALMRTNGVWLITDSRTEQETEGVHECAVP